MGITHRNLPDYGMRDPSKHIILEEIQDQVRAINIGLDRRAEESLPFPRWFKPKPNEDTDERFGISRLSIPPQTCRRFASTAGRGGQALQSLEAIRRAVMEGLDISQLLRNDGVEADDADERGADQGGREDDEEAITFARAREAMVMARDTRRADAIAAMSSDPTTSFFQKCKAHLQQTYSLTIKLGDLAFDGDSLFKILLSVINAGGARRSSVPEVRKALSDYMSKPEHTRLHQAVIDDEYEIYGNVAPISAGERYNFVKKHLR